ncbi:MAG: 50S ribosomal protein L11 methyltransferase [Bacteroidales bacterium]|nr:MAG: 50S ribosomal protein L11 methyltransferase [Bacteroidales bacterium]
MEYKALYFRIDEISDSAREIIIARLYNIGFEGFLETEDGVVGYIPVIIYDKINTEEINFYNNPDFKDIAIEEEFIIEKNWNELWEKSYNPVVIDNKCIIKTSFHKNTPKHKYEIFIDPKMSFGTGHHETTALMIKEILDTGLKGKKVLDMGCGTGVLAIMASKKGASDITAIDINDWAHKNTIENLKTNNTTNVHVYKGDVSLIAGKTYDIILANIHLNVLLDDIKYYQHSLNTEGLLILSGIYKSDLNKIKKECFKYSLKYISFKEKNNWVSVKFKKT